MSSRSHRGSAVVEVVADAFRRAGWRIVPQSSSAGIRPDLVVRRGGRQYVVEIKTSAEPRRDRLVPLLAQAILEAKVAASKTHISPPIRPMAVVGAANLPESVIRDLQSFANAVAPDVSIGIVDLDGSSIFVGRDVEGLSRSVPGQKSKSHMVRQLGGNVDLFSDLNQWMLKVLLAPYIPENLLHAPREKILSVSDLARVAHVSLMSASRCVRQLRAQGFLDESGALRLVNLEPLLHRWRDRQRMAREVPMRWIIPGDPTRQFSAAMHAYMKESGFARLSLRDRYLHPKRRRPSICVALFAAADLLGLKFVHGVAPHIYLEWLDSFAFELLGLTPARSGQRADVFIRISQFRESIFRSTVLHDGIPVSDILQVWLDVSDHPARGASQAAEIWRRVLVPLWKQARR